MYGEFMLNKGGGSPFPYKNAHISSILQLVILVYKQILAMRTDRV